MKKNKEVNIAQQKYAPHNLSSDLEIILIIPDFGEDFDTLPKKPKCKDYATSYHDI